MTVVTLGPRFNSATNAMKSCKDKILPGDDVAVQGRNTEMYCQFFLEKVSSRLFFIKKVSLQAVSSACLIPAVLISNSVRGNKVILEWCGSNTSCGQQSLRRCVDFVTTCNPAQGEEPD